MRVFPVDARALNSGWNRGVVSQRIPYSIQRLGRWMELLLLLWTLLPSAVSARTLVAGKHAKTLQQTIALAQPGDVVEVPVGTWWGPVTLKRRITLRGKGGILDGKGKGKVLIVSAPGTIVEGLTVQGSGKDLGGPDSCIYLKPSATGTILRKNKLRDCAFGIWVHETNKVNIYENSILGRSKLLDSDRGNGIHLFNGSHMIVTKNTIVGARDGIYVSAVHDSLIEGNKLFNQRYGVHYMYSHRNILRKNISENNLTGFALMESHHMTVDRNIAKNNKRNGILFRDAQYCKIVGNQLIKNGEGFFFFSSTDNLIRRNMLRANQTGARIWAGTLRNHVTENAFVGNVQQVYYVGAKDLVWGRKGKGNYWSDYIGWDQNGDGLGDRPYRMDSFTTNLLYRYPSSALLLRSPALELLSHMERKLPLIRVPTIVDLRPLMQWKKAK